MKAMSKVKKSDPTIHLYVALEVPENHLMRKIASREGLESNVTFVGRLDKTDYRLLLNSVDALILPSKLEALPLAILEAMAMGKPVIASKAGGMPEVIVHRRNGLLIDPNPEAIFNAIIEIAGDTRMREEISHNNFTDVLRFDWNRVAENYVRVFRDVCVAHNQNSD